ncbi:MAG: DUF1194 domain-containing protein [Marinosulfonomonas sp.]|nr:DUF1194 domain-containing protein [Marinosulfonomonas sp.]
MVRLAALFYLLFVSIAQADCRQALALGLDVSGSVDAREYRLQLDGLAGALQNADVRAALMSMPNAPATLAVYEWSGPADQHLIIGWTEITSQETLDHFTARLFSSERKATDPSTAIGSSMIYGAALLAQRSDCWTRTLDLSGDGPSNSGPRPRDVTGDAALGQITVNALVIGIDDSRTKGAQTAQIDVLTGYFESEVIRGPAAFTEQALGFDHFKGTMVRKLLRELQGLTVSQLR